MRIGEVIGTVTLSHRLAEVPPGQFVMVAPRRLASLEAGRPVAVEPVVAFDQLGANRSVLVGLSEGREAAMPFHPQPVPLDVYCAAILDGVHTARLPEQPAARPGK